MLLCLLRQHFLLTCYKKSRKVKILSKLRSKCIKLKDLIFFVLRMSCKILHSTSGVMHFHLKLAINVPDELNIKRKRF